MTLTAKESERAYIEAPDAIERIVSQTSSRRDLFRRESRTHEPQIEVVSGRASDGSLLAEGSSSEASGMRVVQAVSDREHLRERVEEGVRVAREDGVRVHRRLLDGLVRQVCRCSGTCGGGATRV